MNIEVANRLQKLRKEKGYSQEQLAEALGISRQAISKWERAESSPDTDNLICLAKLYGISLDELLSTDESFEEIVENNEVVVNEAESDEVIKFNVKIPKIAKKITKKDKIIELLEVLNVFAIGILYFILGWVFNLWHPAWIIFLFIPINSSLIEAILTKKADEFAFPVLLAAIYLFLGTVYNLWHPGWIIFITIPLYYGIIEFFEKNND